ETTRLHDGTHTIHLKVAPVGHSARWQTVSEHYAVCATCGDPHPCGDTMTAEAAARTTRELETLLGAYRPGVCFHCHAAIGTEPHVAFPEQSLLIPDALGPTFHAQRRCCWAA